MIQLNWLNDCYGANGHRSFHDLSSRRVVFRCDDGIQVDSMPSGKLNQLAVNWPIGCYLLSCVFL